VLIVRRSINLMPWNETVTAENYRCEGDRAYRSAILEQYKVYVEMADRVSARRALTNTFFLSLNTAIFVLFGVFWNETPSLSPWLLLPPLVIILGQCTSWYWLVRSYRQLNSAKFAVVGALEDRLPAYAYSRAEWGALGEGKDWRRYLPLTHLEQWVPVLFALVYVAGFLLLVLTDG
jgi:hypothetical protein